MAELPEGIGDKYFIRNDHVILLASISCPFGIVTIFAIYPHPITDFARPKDVLCQPLSSPKTSSRTPRCFTVVCFSPASKT